MKAYTALKPLDILRNMKCMYTDHTIPTKLFLYFLKL